MDSEKDIYGGTILVVDDENDFLEICEYFFEKQFNYRVITSDKGSEVTSLLQKYAIETLILDLNMPGLNGIELLTPISQIDKNLPVIIISAYYSLETAISAFRNGAYDYIKNLSNLTISGN